MNGWHHRTLAVLDVESTGVDMWNDRIVSYAVGYVGGGEPTRVRTGLVNPGVPIPPDATAIHGITDEMAAGGEPAASAVARIVADLLDVFRRGVPVIGWNVCFDLTMLGAEAARYGIPFPAAAVRPVVDGLILDKQVDKWRKGSRRLVDVAAHYGVPIPEGEAHTAGADAVAAARVVWKIAQRYPQVRARTLGELHDRQAEWWAVEQADSLRDYFDREGVEHDGVDGSWPIRGRRGRGVCMSTVGVDADIPGA